MNFSHHIVPALAGAVVGATLTAIIVAGPLSPEDVHLDAIHNEMTHETEAALRETVEVHDGSLTALRDMHAHAIEHLGVFEDQPDSYGVTSEWSPQWHLRWIDVRHDDRTVRIYHATDVDRPGRRFTAIWDGGDPTHWQRAH